VILFGAALGAVVPAYCLIRNALDWRYGIGSREALLWPSCIFLGATIGTENTFSSHVVVAISIAANMFLYALNACVLLLILQVIFRRGTPTV
jgi:hypothetical protein